MTTTTVLHGTARGITINRAVDTLVGDLDLQGFLGLDESIPAGYGSIRIEMDIDADCSDRELDELLEFARGHSPVCNTICRPVHVELERVRKPAV